MNLLEKPHFGVLLKCKDWALLGLRLYFQMRMVILSL